MGRLAPHIQGLFLVPRGEQAHRERLAVLGLLTSGSLPAQMPSAAWGGEGRTPPTAGADAHPPQVHDQVARWGKRAPDMLLISVNLNFPQLIPRAVPRPRVGGKMDKGRPL